MTCKGCSGAISRVLTKAKDEGLVADFSVDLDSQHVLVTPGSDSYEDVLKRIQKTGKAVNIGRNGDNEPEAFTPRGEERLEAFKTATASTSA